ncbi:hypothetical protein F4778DRAFT_718962 [Xylariomycetidae sp. FL2044]|nr:hypothetical protein F4778DRAFT_718962 [Xylariomycetidae sp. FL2044]
MRHTLAERNRPLGHSLLWERTPTGALDTSTERVKKMHNCFRESFVNCTHFVVTDECGQRSAIEGTAYSLSPADAIHLLLACTEGRSVETFRIALTGHLAYLYPSQIVSIPNHDSLAEHLRELELQWIIQDNSVTTMAFDIISMARNLRKLHLSWHGHPSSGECLLKLIQLPTLPAIQELRIWFR